MEEQVDLKLVGWYQHSTLCPKCNKNYFSKDGICRTPNCGQLRDRDPEIVRERAADKRIIGKVWDSKSHKYLPASKGGIKRC